MGGRINTIMQTCFFAVSGVLPRDEAIEAINDSIRKTYGKKGEEIVQMNIAAVDQHGRNLHEVQLPARSPATPNSARQSRRRRPSSCAMSWVK